MFLLKPLCILEIYSHRAGRQIKKDITERCILVFNLALPNFVTISLS